MLKQRVLTTLWGIPILVAAIWFSEPIPWFTVFIAAWGGLGSLELYRLVTAARVPPLTCFGLIWTLLVILSRDSDILSMLSTRFDTNLLMPLLLVSAIVLPLIWLTLRPPRENALLRTAWTVAGILYAGWLLSHLVAVRGLDDGRNWVFLALFATFASDTAAFFTGRAIGRHKLAPNISPGKTWEGTIGGIIGAIIISLFFVLPTPLSLPLSLWQAATLGLLVSIFGQLGDLIESKFKRNIGVKDSGKIIPGHGGILDRMDSIVFAGLVVYYYAVWVIQ